MLARLFGKKNDHPMADVKSAQALLNDLSKNDALKSVIELTEWIESVAGSKEFKLADQWAVLSLLDETAQPYKSKLSAECFTLPDLNTFHGNRLCHVLGNLYRQIANAYFAIFSRYCESDRGDSIKASVPLLVLRAVRAMRAQLKYDAVHYRSHDAALWCRCAELFRHAEQHHYLESHLSLYGASSKATSVRLELGQLLAWYACGINGLSPRSMHLTERLIAHYASFVTITADLTRKALFRFDLEHPLDPVRVNFEATAHPLMRYIGMADMQVKLEVLIKSLEKDCIPQELNLGGTFAAEWVLEAAQHVLTYLLAPPMRLSKRLPINSVLNVAAGFDCVVGYCKASGQENNAPLPMQFTMENASRSGFCAVLSGQGADSMRIGQLLGMQVAGVPRMGAAVVRRMLRDTGGQLHVGAELLTNQVFEVILSQSITVENEFGRPALWLHTKTEFENSTVRLLMQLDTYSMQRSLKTSFEGKNYLLIPRELDEKGQDYDLASFRLVEQETGETQD